MSSITNAPSKLAVGHVAPAFRVVDAFGHMVEVGPERTRPLLLSFYRYSACALCNLRVHHLIQRYPVYHAQGLDMVAVFESSQASIRQYVGKQDAPFPIIPDPLAALFDLYGVETSEEKVNATMAHPDTAQHVRDAATLGHPLMREEGCNFFRIPADFLIEAGAKIGIAFYAERVGHHLPFETLEAHLGITS